MYDGIIPALVEFYNKLAICFCRFQVDNRVHFVVYEICIPFTMPYFHHIDMFKQPLQSRLFQYSAFHR